MCGDATHAGGNAHPLMAEKICGPEFYTSRYGFRRFLYVCSECARHHGPGWGRDDVQMEAGG